MYQSWLVEYLIKNRDSIRENILSSEGEDVELLLDDDVYCMLVDVERVLKYLIENGRISERELLILDIVSSRRSYNKLQHEVKISRYTLRDTFAETCFRIAFILGYPFTDDGLLEYIKKKYKLSNMEVDKIKSYIESKHRFSILRNEVEIE
jgi:hypothetical protein